MPKIIQITDYLFLTDEGRIYRLQYNSKDMKYDDIPAIDITDTIFQPNQINEPKQ
jgi:hypothetical protein